MPRHPAAQPLLEGSASPITRTRGGTTITQHSGASTTAHDTVNRSSAVGSSNSLFGSPVGPSAESPSSDATNTAPSQVRKERAFTHMAGMTKNDRLFCPTLESNYTHQQQPHQGHHHNNTWYAEHCLPTHPSSDPIATVSDEDVQPAVVDIVPATKKEDREIEPAVQEWNGKGGSQETHKLSNISSAEKQKNKDTVSGDLAETLQKKEEEESATSVSEFPHQRVASLRREGPRAVAATTQRFDGGDASESSKLLSGPSPNREGYSADSRQKSNKKGYDSTAPVVRIDETSNEQQQEEDIYDWHNVWLFRVKTYYLFFHWTYIASVALLFSTLMFLSELKSGETSFLSTTFVAVSAVTCTGLSNVDMTAWNNFSSSIWHLCMVAGGTVFTSVVPPLLRYITLKELQKHDESMSDETIISERKRRWLKKKKLYVNKLLVTSTIMMWTTGLYWFFCQFIGFCLLLIENGPHFAATRSISSFNNSTFSAAQKQSHEVYTLFVFCVLVPAGNALFPLFLRFLLNFERKIVMFVVVWKEKRREAAAAAAGNDRDADPSWVEILAGSSRGAGNFRFSLSETLPSFLLPQQAQQQQQQLGRTDSQASAVPQRPSFYNAEYGTESFLGVKVHRNKWVHGFDMILASNHPANYHQLLFSTGETVYLLIAWMLIVLSQFVPFLAQQWEDVLAPFSGPQKILVSLCQSISTRFAGIMLIDLALLSPGHIVLMILGLYIPAIPVPTNRTRRKWKEMIKAGFWRLLTSRFWWLFLAICTIIFIEENNIEVPYTRQSCQSCQKSNKTHLNESLIPPLPFDTNHSRFVLSNITTTQAPSNNNSNAIPAMQGKTGITTRVIFEVLSGYATSGISLAMPDAPYSFSGSLGAVSQIIIMIVMLFGRHRGMDLGLDLGLTDIAREDAQADKAERRATLTRQAAENFFLEGIAKEKSLYGEDIDEENQKQQHQVSADACGSSRSVGEGDVSKKSSFRRQKTTSEQRAAISTSRYQSGKNINNVGETDEKTLYHSANSLLSKAVGSGDANSPSNSSQSFAALSKKRSPPQPEHTSTPVRMEEQHQFDNVNVSMATMPRGSAPTEDESSPLPPVLAHTQVHLQEGDEEETYHEHDNDEGMEPQVHVPTEVLSTPAFTKRSEQASVEIPQIQETFVSSASRGGPGKATPSPAQVTRTSSVPATTYNNENWSHHEGNVSETFVVPTQVLEEIPSGTDDDDDAIYPVSPQLPPKALSRNQSSSALRVTSSNVVGGHHHATPGGRTLSYSRSPSQPVFHHRQGNTTTTMSGEGSTPHQIQLERTVSNTGNNSVTSATASQHAHTGATAAAAMAWSLSSPPPEAGGTLVGEQKEDNTMMMMRSGGRPASVEPQSIVGGSSALASSVPARVGMTKRDLKQLSNERRRKEKEGTWLEEEYEPCLGAGETTST